MLTLKSITPSLCTTASVWLYHTCKANKPNHGIPIIGESTYLLSCFLLGVVQGSPLSARTDDRILRHCSLPRLASPKGKHKHDIAVMQDSKHICSIVLLRNAAEEVQAIECSLRFVHRTLLCLQSTSASMQHSAKFGRSVLTQALAVTDGTGITKAISSYDSLTLNCCLCCFKYSRGCCSPRLGQLSSAFCVRVMTLSRLLRLRKGHLSR